MPRKKKKKTDQPEKKPSVKKPDVFNPAFKELVSLGEMNSSQTTEPPQERIKPKPVVEPDEDRIFLEAMSDVQPVTRKKILFENPDSIHHHPTLRTLMK
ncbi:MAG TPA: hypothetical protein ENN86_02710 [Desulfobacteraceae bacterium]|nr:hypothetical protein [Desulfobacteraceae bacterium]